MFDSLDWYEHVIDPKDFTLKDFAYFPLFECQCKSCTFLEKRAGSYTVEYRDKALLHNLFMYREYMYIVQRLIRNDGISFFLKQPARFGENIDKRINQA